VPARWTSAWRSGLLSSMGDTAIKPGDVVKLKSGGPKMTVLELLEPAGTSEKAANCAWFGSQTEKVFVEAFALVALKQTASD
jgi:uncharacterized protein YodC (DUF2158 family)